MYHGRMAESLATSIARGVGAQVTFVTTFTPPATVDVSGALTAPPAGPNPAAAVFNWLARPALVTQVAGQRQVVPLSPYGPPPVNVAPLLAALAVVQVGLSVYGAYKLAQWALGGR